ncbi:helix-turn-helix transcriptional regulator (plasmid) [Pedobacter sp. BS3]|uniref:helix-turn-helix domain-containing protein n=1 Tax=Pedobacter sp. BS3 TaxID=2567937 RepID=UPI0011EC1B77|nr:helix-turn-helix transcriptional regulator [Pedobacter sp. BS3]TZF85863.1 helix-turn-helix transcriptional regulator [Pedobacter sp. BS3]
MAKKSAFELAIVDRVREMRKKYKKSQTYIAMILDVTDGYIGQIESTKSASMYTYDQLNKIAIEFNCSPKDFMPEEASPISTNIKD